MAKTYNRIPIQVNVPAKTNFRHAFLTQTNWKGLVENANYLAVDQNSFSECNNIYVNENNVLCTRPVLKHYDDTINTYKDIFVFDNVFITISSTLTPNHTLKIFVDNIEKAQYDLLTYSKIKIIPSDNKLLIFTNKEFLYFDIVNNVIHDCESHDEIGYNLSPASDIFYVPVTKVYFNEVLRQDNSLESKNLYTDRHITRYLYDSTYQYSYNSIIGKNCHVTIGEDEYDFYDVPEGFDKIALERQSILPANAKIQVSEKGNAIAYVKHEHDNYSSYDIYYTSNCQEFVNISKDFTYSSTKNGLTPKISSDGNYCFIVTTTGVYVKSLLGTQEGGEFKYPTWTLLTYSKNGVTYGVVPSSFGSYTKFYDNFVFVDDTMFAFSFQGKLVYVDFDGFYDTTTANSNISKGGVRIFVKTFFNNTYLATATDKYTSIDIDIYKVNKLDGTISKTNEYYTTAEGAPSAIRYIIDTKAFDVNINNIAITCDYKKFSNYEGIVWSIAHCYKVYDKVDDKVYEKACVQLRQLFYRIYTDNKLLEYSTAKKYLILTPNTLFLSATSVTFENGKCEFMSTDELVVSYTMNNMDKTKLLKLKFAVSSDDVYYISNTTECNIDVNYDSLQYSNGLYAIKDNVLYGSNRRNVMQVDIYDGYYDNKSENKLVPDVVKTLKGTYMSFDNTLYISELRKVDNEFKFYVPEITKQVFDTNINNMQPISDTDMAIFLTDAIWYSTYDVENNLYRYNKSRLPASLAKGNDAITSYDNKYTLYCTPRGFAALSYQNFVSTAEQSIAYLSDSIASTYNDFTHNNAVKIFKHLYWIILYKIGGNKVLVLDVRTNSWWPMSLPDNVKINKFVSVDNELLCLLDDFLYTVVGYTKENALNYLYDGKDVIQYFEYHVQSNLASQKLHFNLPNNEKIVDEIIFTSEYKTTSNATLKIERFVSDGTTRFDKPIALDGNTLCFAITRNNCKGLAIKYTLNCYYSFDATSITIKYKVGDEIT